MKILLAMIISLSSTLAFAELSFPLKCNMTMPDGDKGVIIIHAPKEHVLVSNVYMAGKLQTAMDCVPVSGKAKLNLNCEVAGSPLGMTLNISEGQDKSLSSMKGPDFNGTKVSATCY